MLLPELCIPEPGCAAQSCPRCLPWESFPGTRVQITLCWSCAVTQGRAHPTWYTSRGSLDWYQPRLPLQCLLPVPAAPSQVSLCPASLSKLPLSAGSIQPHSSLPLLAGVSCNQSLLEIHWVWEQLWIPLPKLNQMYICSEHCADIRKCSCPLASLGAAARLSNIRWSWEEQVGTAE